MKVLGGNATLHVEVRGHWCYVYLRRRDDGWHIWCADTAGEVAHPGLPQTWAAAYRAGLRLAEKMAPRLKKTGTTRKPRPAR